MANKFTRERVKISEVGQDRLVVEFAQQYSSPPEAFKEYFTNAVDGIYDAGNKNGYVTVVLSPKMSRIAVRDNGQGMSRKQMMALPVSIGESVKKGVADQRGEKGVGLLAFASLGDKLHIVSRQQGNKNYGYLLYEVKGSGENVRIVASYSELNDISDLGAPFKQGTMAVVHVEKDIFNRYFRSQSVRNQISEIYWPIVERDDIGFVVRTENGKEHDLESLALKGERLINEPIPFVTKSKGEEKEHQLHVNLALDLETEAGKVPLYSKGVRVYKDILELGDEELGECELWNCRQIAGFIDDPNLSLTLGRDKVNKKSNAYKGFLEVLKRVNDELWPRVAEKLKERRTEEDNKSLKDAYAALKEAFQRTEPLYIKFRAEAGGTRINWGGTGGGPGGSGTRKWRCGMPRVVAFGIDEKKRRSKLEIELGTPIPLINGSHPDYKAYVTDGRPEDAAEYFMRAIAFPLAVWESQKAQDAGVVYDGPENQIAEVIRRADDLVYAAVGKKPTRKKTTKKKSKKVSSNNKSSKKRSKK